MEASPNTAIITTTITTTTTTNTHQETSTLVTTTTLTQPPHQRPCPRCFSEDTKFCYYNNYSTSQPRHFCRSCRRHWTHSVVLWDIPVGGGTKKNNKRKKKKPMNPTTTSGYCDTTFAPPENQESQAYQCHLTPPPVDVAGNVMVPFEPNVFVSSLFEGVGFEDGVWPFGVT